MKRLGPQGAALIKDYEKCRLSAYLPTADDVPTIGYGHTRDVSMGDTCTQEQADAWFLEDVAWAEECVSEAVNVPLTQEQFDACVSLCFNIGANAFKTSTLVRKLNAGDMAGASLQFLRWDKQRGKVLAGLTRRRMAEVRLFETEAT